jgi:hypothetical protein
MTLPGAGAADLSGTERFSCPEGMNKKHEIMVKAL